MRTGTFTYQVVLSPWRIRTDLRRASQFRSRPFTWPPGGSSPAASLPRGRPMTRSDAGCKAAGDRPATPAERLRREEEYERLDETGAQSKHWLMFDSEPKVDLGMGRDRGPGSQQIRPCKSFGTVAQPVHTEGGFARNCCYSRGMRGTVGTRPRMVASPARTDRPKFQRLFDVMRDRGAATWFASQSVGL
jgi:hypothetical protein